MPQWPAIIAFLVTIPALAEITEKYDRFKNQTVLKYEQNKPSAGLPFYLLSGFEGTNKASKRENVLTFHVSGSGWRYLRCNQTALLVDGKPFSVGKVEHDGRVGTGYVLEFLSIAIPTAALRQLGNAKTVEYKICNDEYRLDDADLAAFKEITESAK